MKNTMLRFGWLILFMAMTVGTALAQEAEATNAASNDGGPGLMIGIFILGVVVIAGLGFAMSSQSADSDSN